MPCYQQMPLVALWSHVFSPGAHPRCSWSRVFLQVLIPLAGPQGPYGVTVLVLGLVVSLESGYGSLTHPSSCSEQRLGHSEC